MCVCGGVGSVSLVVSGDCLRTCIGTDAYHAKFWRFHCKSGIAKGTLRGLARIKICLGEEEKMDDCRYRLLEREGFGMTDQELEKGWHWCPDWDYMLVGPGMEAVNGCTCALPKGE